MGTEEAEAGTEKTINTREKKKNREEKYLARTFMGLVVEKKCLARPSKVDWS